MCRSSSYVQRCLLESFPQTRTGRSEPTPSRGERLSPSSFRPYSSSHSHPTTPLQPPSSFRFYNAFLLTLIPSQTKLLRRSSSPRPRGLSLTAGDTTMRYTTPSFDGTLVPLSRPGDCDLEGSPDELHRRRQRKGRVVGANKDFPGQGRVSGRGAEVEPND